MRPEIDYIILYDQQVSSGSVSIKDENSPLGFPCMGSVGNSPWPISHVIHPALTEIPNEPVAVRINSDTAPFPGEDTFKSMCWLIGSWQLGISHSTH